MRIFANAFLVAFALDAVLAMAAAELTGAGTAWLAGLRTLFTGIVTAASLPLFVLMGIHPGLRWRIFLPPCLFLSWTAMGAMPLPIWFSALDALLIVGALQAAFAATALMSCRLLNSGNAWLLEEHALSGANFSGRTAVGFTALNLLVILPASVAYLVLSVAAGVGHLTQGFVEIRGDGIHLSHREYRRGSQTIHLVAMMHIGEPAFYQDLIETLPMQGAITLAEGVTNDAGQLPERRSYSSIAAGLGLVPQPELGGNNRKLRYADVDLSEFSPETREFLAGVERVMNAETLEAGVRAYLELSDMGSETAVRTLNALKHDLIDLRNDHLFAEIETSLRDYDTVVVPWGALHLPGIQDRIRDLGFEQELAMDRLVIRW